MNVIHRTEIKSTGEIFQAPKNVTFAYQAARSSLSIWYNADDKKDTRYCVVNTGEGFGTGILRATVVTDGFHTYHLIELR